MKKGVQLRNGSDFFRDAFLTNSLASVPDLLAKTMSELIAALKRLREEVEFQVSVQLVT